MKLNKQYFFAALIIFGVQLVLGSNWANAKPCEAEITSYCSQRSTLGYKLDGNWCYDAERTHVEMNAVINGNLRWIDEDGAEKRINDAKKLIEEEKSDKNTNPVRLADKYMYACFINTSVCMYKNGGRTQDSNTFTDYKGCDGGSQASTTSSSSQTNKKANRQSANNQSSSSDDERIKKINDAVDQGNNAHNNKDYAKSINAIKFILANSSNITLKGEATNRLAEYYKDGNGVPKDEAKAQALFEQASVFGNADADAHICQNYQEGTGGVTQNHQTAIKYCTEAANKGHLISMGNLGYLYHAGIGTFNPELGNQWICKAAKQGNSTAIGNAEKLKLSCK